MPSARQIYETLEARRRDLGLSQAEVGERAFGRADNSAFQALRRGSSPSADKLEALCGALGLEFYFGPERTGTTQVGPSGHGVLAFHEDYESVPLVDAELSAGPGSVNYEDMVVADLMFRRDWLRRLGVKSEDARLARVRGESMLPLLHDGDLVLIDTSNRTIPLRPRKPGRPAKISLFAVLDDGEARVKRIEHSTEGRFILHSENSAYFPPEIREPMASDSFRVIGKVLWCAHTFRE